MRQGGVLNLQQKRATKEKWQGLLAKQQFEVREKLLIPAADVAAVWAAEIGAVRTRLLHLTGGMCGSHRAHSPLHGIAGLETALRDAVHDVLRELADSERAPKPAPDDGGETTKAA